MTRTVLPIALALIAIISLSFYEGFYMKDRWNEPGAEAAQLGVRFAQVPLNIGEWEGEDMPVDEEIRKRAGAVNYVSRHYTHVSTGRKVILWLMVGHSRDIWRHTPDICYPNSGYRKSSSQLAHLLELDNGENAKFFTAKFEKEDAFSHTIERVFWTFSHPEKGGWEAPKLGPRYEYGLAKAIYKLYFTSSVMRDEDTIEENVATDFAKVMLPAIDAALYPKEGGGRKKGVRKKGIRRRRRGPRLLQRKRRQTSLRELSQRDPRKASRISQTPCGRHSFAVRW